MSVLTEINRIKTAVTAIINAIKGKGVTVPTTAKVSDLATYIGQITTPVLQSVTVSPSTYAKTVVPASPYNGLSQVTVNAIEIVEQATPEIIVWSSGKIEATATQNAGYVEAGEKSATMELTTQAAKTITPSTSNQVAVSARRYTTGAVTVKGDENLVAGNIKKGVSIFGVAGSYEGGASVPTTSIIVDTENTFSDGYGVDVYVTQFVNGQVTFTHQYVGYCQYQVFNNVVVGSIVTLDCQGFYLDSSTPDTSIGQFGTNYGTAYCFEVCEGGLFAFYE